MSIFGGGLKMLCKHFFQTSCLFSGQKHVLKMDFGEVCVQLLISLTNYLRDTTSQFLYGKLSDRTLEKTEIDSKGTQ